MCRGFAAAVAVLLAIGASGCAQMSSCMTWATGGSASTQWLESLPIIDRPTMPIIESSQPLPPGDHGHQYYALQEIQAQCMAASASPIAASLIAERRGAGSTAGHHDPCSVALRQQVLAAAAAAA